MSKRVPRPLAPALRSALYVPGNRTDLLAKAVTSGADAIVLDLEDAVPEQYKDAARNQVAHAVREYDSGNPPLLVRINAFATTHAEADLDAVLAEALTGVLLPKVESAETVHRLDSLLHALEAARGIELGSTLICPILETALGVMRAYEIGCASTRAAYMGGIGVKGGDLERSIGYRWSAAGEETLSIRSRALVDVRAAEVPNPMSGIWMPIKDLDGLRAFAVQTRDLGYEGMLAIHPSHIPIINEVFSPDEEELERDRRIVEVMRGASRKGLATAVVDGMMVDIAMQQRSLARLAKAGLDG